MAASGACRHEIYLSSRAELHQQRASTCPTSSWRLSRLNTGRVTFTQMSYTVDYTRMPYTVGLRSLRCKYAAGSYTVDYTRMHMRWRRRRQLISSFGARICAGRMQVHRLPCAACSHALLARPPRCEYEVVGSAGAAASNGFAECAAVPGTHGDEVAPVSACVDQVLGRIHLGDSQATARLTVRLHVGYT